MAIEKIGRRLNEEELYIVKDGFEWGFLTDIDSIYNAIFEEIERACNNQNLVKEAYKKT